MTPEPLLSAPSIGRHLSTDESNCRDAYYALHGSLLYHHQYTARFNPVYFRFETNLIAFFDQKSEITERRLSFSDNDIVDLFTAVEAKNRQNAIPNL